MTPPVSPRELQLRASKSVVSLILESILSTVDEAIDRLGPLPLNQTVQLIPDPAEIAEEGHGQ